MVECSGIEPHKIEIPAVMLGMAGSARSFSHGRMVAERRAESRRQRFVTSQAAPGVGAALTQLMAGSTLPYALQLCVRRGQRSGRDELATRAARH